MRTLLSGILLLALVSCKRDSTEPPDVLTVALTVPAEFVGVGDSVQLTARAVNGAGNAVSTAPITWSSSNPQIATVSTAGVVKGVAVGEVTISARSGASSASTLFNVDANPCQNVTPFGVGEVRRYRGAGLTCITLSPSTSTQQYLYVVGNAKPVQDDTLAYSLSQAATSALVQPELFRVTNDVMALADAQRIQVADAVEDRLRAFERQVVSDALPNTQSRGAGIRPGAASLQISAALADVGDTVTIRVPNLNTGKSICADAVSIRAVVRTVSQRAVIMEDVTSPSGRLTSTDYQAIAQEFDTIIYPTDTLWFGAPTDLNSDSRVSILYTPEVNKLTPAGSTGIVGGFFFGGDLIRRTEYPTSNACRNQTNEQEIFYLLAPDPQGTINGNARTTAGVRQVTRGTIAHEFQHMINQSVRQYNPEVKAFETPWLNEGLAHFAEEAVGRAVNGFSEFQSLRTTDVNPSAVNQNDYIAFYRQNLTRFRFWMLKPDTASPTSQRARTELASRGAAWALVRYAADQYANGNAKAFFRKLAAGPEVDVSNLVLRTGRTFDELIGGWLVANYTDGLVPPFATRYQYTSWDLRDVMSGVNSGAFPLLVTGFPGNFTSTSFSGSGNYYLHTRPVTGTQTVRITTPSGGAITNSGARVWVARVF